LAFSLWWTGGDERAVWEAGNGIRPV